MTETLIEQPLCVFMVGIPYSGKSTFIARHKWLARMPKVSLDKTVLRLAKGDYSKWAEVVEEAGRQMLAYQNNLIAQKTSFVIDKTNVVSDERVKLILQLKDAGYKVVAIALEPPSAAELQKRILSRSDKRIPMEVIEGMRKNFLAGKERLAEEFDGVVYVRQDGKYEI